jgi:hypothetical protein
MVCLLSKQQQENMSTSGRTFKRSWKGTLGFLLKIIADDKMWV